MRRTMPSIYFVADFSYNPESETPLKIFELGDAFISGYPNKTFGHENLTVYQRFCNYLQKQYPNALFIQAFPGGLNITDFSDQSQFMTYDKANLFDDSPNKYSPSFNSIICLLESINLNRHKRSKDSRQLLLHVSHSRIKCELYSELKSDQKLEFFNTSETVLAALNNKKIFHEFADNSDIYPRTMCLELENDNCLDQVKSFLTEEKAEYFVIKPINGTRSEGVHILSRLKLLQSIQLIRSKLLFPEDRYRYLDGLVVQSCHFSQPIFHKGKIYLAKGRAFLRADFDENDEIKIPKLSLITGYWQLAKNPCSTIADETAIANGAANPDGILAIDNEDWKAISNLFCANLPRIIQKMLTHKMPLQFNYFAQKNNVQKITSLKENYEKVFSDFFNRQTVVPEGPLALQQFYCLWNNYISNRSNNALVKEKIIDLVGIDQKYKSILPYNNQSLTSFVQDCVTIFFGGTANTLRREPSFANKLTYEGKAVLGALLIGFGVSFLYTGSFSAQSIVLGLYLSLGLYLINTLNRYLSAIHVRSYFFHETKPATELSINIPQPSMNNLSKLGI
jgi:hypothetical protein